MASILRQIVAGPRARHPEANLDLCYVSDSSPIIIATSGPSGTYPQLAYRNPLSELVKFLDKKHGRNWAIWEFRAEGTGYPDSEVYDRVYHYPWPDHHPPPFALMPLMMASMRNWLKGEKASGGEGDGGERAVVVHCKAGKGRSGTVSCSYLIAEEGWTADDALRRFSERRMRPGFGSGVSIPSQLRWIGYVDRWAKHGKRYVEQEVQILEVHVWGLRDGVKVAIEGYVDQGRTIKLFHTFSKQEREIVRGPLKKSTGFSDVVSEVMNLKDNTKPKLFSGADKMEQQEAEKVTMDAAVESDASAANATASGDVVFRPAQPVILPTSDVNIDFERRNKASYGMSMVTSVAHVWFNAFFEGNGPERDGEPLDSGVFEIEFDAMDGIKGSLRKGTRAFDKMAVVWKTAGDATRGRKASTVIELPKLGEEVPQSQPADWKLHSDPSPSHGTKDLGLRAETPASRDVSRASSTAASDRETDPESDTEKVQSYGVSEAEKEARQPIALPVIDDNHTAGHQTKKDGTDNTTTA